MDIVIERAALYLCEFLYEDPDDLPSPFNPAVGLKVTRSIQQRSGQPESLHNRPGLLSWSTTEWESLTYSEIVTWALTCWTLVFKDKHCRKIEIVHFGEDKTSEVK